MQLEILEFYPKEKTDEGFISGEIKIRVHDSKINILGIYVARRTNGKWIILTPSRTVVDSTGAKQKFPIVTFDEGDHKELMAALYERVPGFVEKLLEDKENPVIFQVPQPKEESRQPQVAAKHAKTSQTPAKLPMPKLWRDLPPRKALPKSKEKYG